MIKPLNSACLREVCVGDQGTGEIYGYFSFPVCQLPGARRVREKTPWPLPGKCGMGSATAEQLFPDNTRKSCAQLFHFLNQWMIQRCDLLHNVVLEQNQNNYLTQCSPGKLLVHV